MTAMLYERANVLLEAQVGNELVALDVDRGACFGFNHVAAIVWQYLSSPKSFDELRSLLLDEFSVSVDQCSLELRELIGAMIENGIVRPVDA